MARDLAKWEMRVVNSPAFPNIVMGICFCTANRQVFGEKEADSPNTIMFQILNNGFDFKNGGCLFCINQVEAKGMIHLLTTALKEWEEAESKTTV